MNRKPGERRYAESDVISPDLIGRAITAVVPVTALITAAGIKRQSNCFTRDCVEHFIRFPEGFKRPTRIYQLLRVIVDGGSGG